MDASGNSRETGQLMINEESLANCQEAENQWRCLVPSCGKVLSRKQTLKAHLVSVHKLPCAVEVKRYKQYECDPDVEIPRATMYYKKRKMEQDGDLGDEDIVEQNIVINEAFITPHLTVEQTSYESVDMDIDDDTNTNYDMGDVGTINDTIVTDHKDDVILTEQEPSDNSVPLYVLKCDSCVKGLYSSSISQTEHELAVLAFAARHNLSDTALEDLLTLVSLHIPEKNLIQPDIVKLKEKVGFDKKFLKNFVFCTVCENTIPDESDQCVTPDCTGQKPSNRNKSFFMTAEIKTQLSEMLSKDGLWDSIQDKADVVVTSITDITDGEAYQQLKEEGNFLKDKNNITLTLFTDGIPLFKSSSISLWPVYLLVNEVPRHERFKRKNMIVWGVWQGSGKPAMTVYLKELVMDLQDLYHNGMSFVYKGESVHTKAMLVVATMDLQARAAVLKMTQHNGEFACVFCLEKGKQVKTGKGHCKAFPFSENLSLRTSEGIRKDSHEAKVAKQKVHGFMGESTFLFLPQFELNTNIVVDYMHGILLGICKKFLTMWFDSSYSKKPFYIGRKVQIIDRSLTRITPPYSITRLPRKIQNTFHHWKASELRAWLLFYSLPCLQGQLPEIYLQHFSLLVEATFNLLTEGISNEDLDRTELLFKTFCRTAADLYGESLMGLNMHNLLHITTCVRKWGPLWAWSCFCFESFNGEIKRTIHGTGNVCLQIFWALFAQKHIENASRSVNNDRILSFIKNQTGSHDTKVANTTAPCIVKKTFSLSANFSFPKSVREKLLQFTGKSGTNSFMKAKRVLVNGRFVYSKDLSKVKKRNSYTASIIDSKSNKKFLEINYFVVEKESSHVFAVGKELTTGTPVLPGNAPHIQQHEYKSVELTVEKAMYIHEVLMSFEVGGLRFLSRIPNTLEGD